MTSQHIQKTLESIPKYKNGSKAIPKDEIVVQFSALSQALTEQHEKDVQSFREIILQNAKEEYIGASSYLVVNVDILMNKLTTINKKKQ